MLPDDITIISGRHRGRRFVRIHGRQYVAVDTLSRPSYLQEQVGASYFQKHKDTWLETE